MVAIAAGVAAVAAAGATAYSSSQSAGAARSAARAQERAAAQANLTQRELFEQTREDVRPFRETGYRALNRLNRAFITNENRRQSPAPPTAAQVASTLTNDPGYQFRLQEGQRALERSASARGGLLSGNTLRDLTRFGQGVASQEYDAAYGRAINDYQLRYNRFQQDRTNRFNRLASLAGIGQTSTQQLGADRGALGQQIGANLIGAGNANAAGRIGSANAVNAGISGGVNAINSGLQNYLYLSQYNNPAATQPQAPLGSYYQDDGTSQLSGY